ncbi:2-oxo-4-hydroxy-4-carboxy-5-ureidoimidazoline decarboxylase [Luteolibacter arcticus]|uniref:2-oxo-4-hydroxy-4-carboxy-5-ureidoimidazoline decarboxylase n=1 Tax=Luteolibacter arcticus TaxID=1581411 RepID=A0ABT3GJS3_9BACT|nr:2-oxo-4-hydroxy-4-carboxy-5-ureidoimidazoline decarboxylase [Luteolibacter arcticus]MCW1923747.1 2-oxo-4-hydroxy-4-carboxy-5-ureidoimidazoline decarboxylase [Luteolibacter arcticus]
MGGDRVEVRTLTVDALNAMPKAEFVACLGGIYEHSPWVAEQTAGERPFAGKKHIADRMRAAVENADDTAKLALIRAHPDLAGKLARAGTLSAESTREQAGLGLDRLSDAEFERFTGLNTRYRERFGFPFVICVRLTDRPGIVAAFERRLENDAEAEMAEALRQIHHIARLRLDDLVTDS